MKKIAFALAFSFFSFQIIAQNSIPEPEKKYKFGFDFGVNYSFAFVNKPLPNTKEISNGIGARLGVLSEFKISKKLYLSPKAEISFNNAKINYEYSDDSYRIMPLTLELMVPVKVYLAKGKWNSYFFAGPNFKIPIARKSPFENFFEPNSDLSIDLGVGAEQRFEKYKFSPELRFSFGFLNVNRDPSLTYVYNGSVSLVLKFIE